VLISTDTNFIWRGENQFSFLISSNSNYCQHTYSTAQKEQIKETKRTRIKKKGGYFTKQKNVIPT
jgi:hypothetical protein